MTSEIAIYTEISLCSWDQEKLIIQIELWKKRAISYNKENPGIHMLYCHYPSLLMYKSRTEVLDLEPRQTLRERLLVTYAMQTDPCLPSL